jgi:hypothetical protein
MSLCCHGLRIVVSPLVGYMSGAQEVRCSGWPLKGLQVALQPRIPGLADGLRAAGCTPGDSSLSPRQCMHAGA